MKRIDTKFYTADLTKDGWAQVRELAEEWITEGHFEGDPLKCVVNAYITLLMLEKELEEDAASGSIH